MDKEKAEHWVQELTGLLTSKELVAVAVGPGDRVDVRPVVFKGSYFVEHQGGDCVVALSDTYGVMTGAEEWSIDPDRRTVHAQTTNGYGEVIRFAWMDLDRGGQSWGDWRDAQERLWRI